MCRRGPTHGSRPSARCAQPRASAPGGELLFACSVGIGCGHAIGIRPEARAGHVERFAYSGWPIRRDCAARAWVGLGGRLAADLTAERRHQLSADEHRCKRASREDRVAEGGWKAKEATINRSWTHVVGRGRRRDDQGRQDQGVFDPRRAGAGHQPIIRKHDRLLDTPLRTPGERGGQETPLHPLTG